MRPTSSSIVDHTSCSLQLPADNIDLFVLFSPAISVDSVIMERAVAVALVSLTRSRETIHQDTVQRGTYICNSKHIDKFRTVVLD